ncbi:MAG: DUF998 domain-containing protein [Candidatus Odinarchaeota archaeon]
MMYRKFNVEKFGPVFGLAAILTVLFFTLTAYFLYPGYDIFTQTLSKLGARSGTGFLFNMGLLLSGILFIPFYYSIHQWITHEKPWLATARLLTGILGAVFLMAVGLFPDVPGMETIHFVVAFLFFFLTSIATAILSYEILKFDLLEPFYGWIGIACTIMTMIHGLVSIQDQVPITQKIAVIFYLVWAFLLALRLWHSKKADLT